MSSSSSSSTTNKTENINFNNMDYGDGGGAAGGLADNVNMSRSELNVDEVSVSETDHGAVAAGKDVAEKALSVQETAINRSFDDTEDSREFAEGVFIEATDAVTDSNRSAMQQVGQQTDRALAFAKQATRSEAGKIAENLTKYMMWGGAGLLAVILVTRSS